MMEKAVKINWVFLVLEKHPICHKEIGYFFSVRM
jgi:hypothetical protein